MSNTDKTIRIGVDASEATQNISQVRQLTKQANEESNSAVKENVRLLQQKNQLEQTYSYRRIRDAQEDIRYAQRELEIWRLTREEQSKGLSGDKRSKFNSETASELRARQIDILRDKGSLDDLRYKADLAKEEEREKKKKEKEEAAGRLTSSDVMRGGGVINSAARGDIGEALMGLGGRLAIAGAIIYGLKTLAGSILNNAKEVESDVQGYAALRQKTKEQALDEILKFGKEDVLGVKGKDYLTKYYMPFLYASGGRANDDSITNLGAAGRATNLQPQLLESLLSTGRYSRNGTGVNTISNFEEYLKNTGRHIAQLPEILQTYIGIATGILNRTGSIDSIGLQTTLASIGKSYGVEGVNLDRYAGGMEKMGSMSSNPVIFALQQRVLRKLYPNMSQWDKLGIMEDSLSNFDYIKNMIEEMKSMGGENGKFFMRSYSNQVGVGWSKKDIDRIYANGLQKDDLKGSKLDNAYIERSKTNVFGQEAADAKIENTKDAIKTLNADLIEYFVKLFENDEKLNKKLIDEIREAKKEGRISARSAAMREDIVNKGNPFGW